MEKNLPVINVKGFVFAVIIIVCIINKLLLQTQP